jgi:hypothetical protein
MPPIPSLVSAQYTSIPATGTTPMVICSHCQTLKLPRNSLARKEEHLRTCAAFALSPLSTQRDEHGRTLLEDSIAKRATRTKPGNSNKTAEEQEMLKLRRLGAVLAYGNVGPELQEGIQERVERILKGESSAMGARSVHAPTRPFQPLPLDNDTSEGAGLEGFDSPEAFDTPSIANVGSNNQSMAALLESATRSTPAPSIMGNPRKRPLPTGFEDEIPHLVPMPQTNRTANNTQQPKRYKHAELYLDEDDLAFMTSAHTPREEKFAAMVERLARLVRLRDMR